MNEFLTQPIAIGQLLLNPIAFWTAYFGIAYLLRNKINSIGMYGDYGIDGVNEIFGKGVAWCYIFNLFFVYYSLKMGFAIFGEESLDTLNYPIFLALICMAIIIFSNITWVVGAIISSVFTVVGILGIILTNATSPANEMARGIFKWII